MITCDKCGYIDTKENLTSFDNIFYLCHDCFDEFWDLFMEQDDIDMLTSIENFLKEEEELKEEEVKEEKVKEEDIKECVRCHKLLHNKNEEKEDPGTKLIFCSCCYTVMTYDYYKHENKISNYIKFVYTYIGMQNKVKHLSDESVLLKCNSYEEALKEYKEIRIGLENGKEKDENSREPLDISLPKLEDYLSYTGEMVHIQIK